ncbi:cold-shock protein [Marinirhabdus gelatinilytica]|uniref:Putative cold-shock DNA-binding protein n=1 Tax=Marinirhabdus gelatinilytica TaxID=1703343 RepID=A0A370QA93_9FLAO|nr:cold shock domain-containing protein [Marinirhabdus gelatinilytica]RDK85219.1 putative cold-shock DNA-binding protein [Marinirhabdus gelatinilytica]
MAKSNQSYNKSEKEKKRLEKREAKKKKKEARKLDKEMLEKSGIDLVYVDHMGNLVDTPPDPSEKEEIEAEDIVVGVPKTPEGEKEEFDPTRTGTVDYFDHSKGFGFIIDAENNEKYFTHISGHLDEITEGNRVSFELEKGQRGMNAVKVQLA